MWFTNQKQVIIIIARYFGITLMAIILAVVVVIFSSQAITKVGDSISQKQKLSKILSTKIENIEQLKKSLEIIGDNDKKIQAVYPPADNILEFVSALESIASQNSLKQNLSFAGFSSDSNAGEMAGTKTNYTINLNGTINTLKAYLEQIEKITFANKIGAVNLLAAPPHGWDGDSTITINGTLYVQ